MNAYAVYAKNEKLRLESSSGAVFSLLAEWVLNKSGVVYGVAMASDVKSAQFIRVDNTDELCRLRGSKYFQARVGTAFQQVKADLEAGKVVLFSGTGCQVNGLKCYLGKEYNTLFCVDVICHGVPSPKLWRQYVQYVEEKVNSKLVNVNFRCKDNSWSDFGIKRIDKKHKAMYASKDKDPYMLMFLRDYCLRPSCYECVAKQKKFSDLTIADFWGIDKVIPAMNDGKGVSLVIVRTGKGVEIFDCIKSDTVCKEVLYEDGVKGNRAEYSSARRPIEREYFFGDMNAMSFEQLKSKYAVPVHVPLLRRLKMKAILISKKLHVPKISKLGGWINYGLLFTFEKEYRK